jgi:hypothetical protein
MRERERILSSLESVYREAFEAAREDGDGARARALDFEFQRDQVQLEVLLDIRELLAHPPGPPAPPPEGDEGGSVTGLIDKAQALRKLTRFR